MIIYAYAQMIICGLHCSRQGDGSLSANLGSFFGFEDFTGFLISPVQLGDPIRRLVQPAVMQSSTQDGELHVATLQLACGYIRVSNKQHLTVRSGMLAVNLARLTVHSRCRTAHKTASISEGR